MQSDVVVVGAGPVGLMLAGELCLGGADVVVLERLDAPSTRSRASTLHARTAELLDQRCFPGGTSLLTALGTARREPVGHLGGLPLDLGVVDSPYSGQWKVAQATLEQVLSSWVTALGGRVLRRHDVRGVHDLGDRVEVTAEAAGGPARWEAAFAVACDGEGSQVRDAAGVRLTGSPGRRLLLRADLVGVDLRPRRFERLPAGVAVAGMLPGGMTRVLLHEFGRHPDPGRAPVTFAELVRAWAAVTGEDLAGATPVCLDTVSDAARQADRYRRGRILLAGDAAHVQLPVGGQPINLGLQDAVNLGWKLAAEVRGRAPAGVLDTYHDERHPVAARVLRDTVRQTEVLFGPPPVDDVRPVLAELVALPGVDRRLAEAVAGLDVRYPMPGPDHPVVGARLPPATLVEAGRRVDLVESLRAGRVLLIDLTGRGPSPLAPLTGCWGSAVHQVAGEVVTARAWPGQACVVRPDGHLAWVGPADPAAVAAALSRWVRPRTQPSLARPPLARSSPTRSSPTRPPQSMPDPAPGLSGHTDRTPCRDGGRPWVNC